MALPKVWTSDPLKGERLPRLCPRRLCLAKKKYQKEIYILLALRELREARFAQCVCIAERTFFLLF
jgi:hypothetical protein